MKTETQKWEELANEAMDDAHAWKREAMTLRDKVSESREMLRDINRWLEVNLSRGRINAGTANRDGDLVSQIRAILAKLQD